MAEPMMLRVVERQVRMFSRFWRSSVMFSFIQPLLFLGALGFGLGGLIDRNAGQVGGMSYREFVVPGLVAASAMQSASFDSLWAVMAGLKWIGSFKAMVATPLSPTDVYDGIVTWNVLRTGMGITGFLAVAAVLGAVHSPWAVLSLPAAMLTAAAFGAPLSAFSATQETDAKFPLIVRLGIVPLFLFSGTFFPISQLPHAVRPLAKVSPLWHGVELCRAATNGTVQVGAALVHVTVLVVVAVAGWTWGRRTFTRRLSL